MAIRHADMQSKIPFGFQTNGRIREVMDSDIINLVKSVFTLVMRLKMTISFKNMVGKNIMHTYGVT
jgi:hypothetical protein